MWPYRLITQLAEPLIARYLQQRVTKGKEDPTRLDERFGKASQPRPSGKLIWCHAASVGESLSVLSLLQKLRSQHPQTTILLTTGTITSARLIESRRAEGIIHQYVPVDTPKAVRDFLDHWQPDLALWMESELWPNLLAGLKQCGVPAILLNGRMSARSFRKWQRLRPWAKEILSTFVLCLAQTHQAAEYLNMLGAQNVRTLGNLKFTTDPLPYDSEKLKALETVVAGRRVWLMASTHAGEDEIAIATHQKLSRDFSNLLTIIAPRHPHRAAEIRLLLEQSRLEYSVRSEGQIIHEKTGIYLADTMGEMGLFYRLAPLTCLGGSFTWGGHNPIEPAQLGCAMIFGPAMTNFQEIADEFLAQQAALQISSGEDLPAALMRLLNEPKFADNLRSEAALLLQSKQQIMADTLQALQPWLQQRGIA